MKSGDRIETRSTPVITGFVYKATKKQTAIEIVMVLDDGVKSLKGKDGAFQPSNAPIPVDSPFRKSFKKGDEVSFLDTDRTPITGVIVAKEGISYEISAGQYVYTKLPTGLTATGNNLGAEREFSPKDRVEFTESKTQEIIQGTVRRKNKTSYCVIGVGGKTEYGVPGSMLRPATRPAIVHAPTPVDKWGLSGYRADKRLSEETIAFSATITLNGKPVIHASNRGHGGCNEYQPARGETYDIVDKLVADIKATLSPHGLDDLTDTVDQWVSWAADKDYNEISFVESEKDFQAEVTELSAAFK